MTDPRPSAARRGVRAIAAVVGLALLVGLVALYAARKVIAREVLTGWLRSHGVASQVGVAALGLDRFAGRVSAGDPRAPDFVAGDASVTYGIRGLGFEVRSATLRGPTLRGRLHDGRLSFGSLDPLIEEFRKKPPQPDTREPRVQIEGGVLLLATDYGLVRLLVDAVVDKGRLVSLKARSDRARLQGRGFAADVGAASATLQTTGERVTLTLDAPLDGVQAGGKAARSARLTLSGDAPYPDLKRKLAVGAVGLHGTFAAQQVTLGGDIFSAPRLAADFRGQSSGWIEDFALAGAATADLNGAAAAVGAARLSAARLSVRAADLRWTRRGGGAVSATPQATVFVRDLAAGGLRVSQVQAEGAGPVSLGPGGIRAATMASLYGRGAWTGLGLPKATDEATVSALKRAAQGFHIAAPAVAVGLEGGVLRLALPQPVRLAADRGGVLTVSSRADMPVLGPGGGALRFALRDGGLPTVDADIQRLNVAGGAVTARGGLKASGSIGLVDGGALEAFGTFQAVNGSLRFTADRCAPVSARRLVFGANDLERLAGRLCSWRGPMFTLAKGDWRLRAQVDGLTADAPFLQARIAGGAGAVTAEQVAGRLGVTALLGDAKVADTAPQTRFEPLKLGATATLADQQWMADLTFSTPGGEPVAKAALHHDTRDGQGGLTADTGVLRFADGGLQPLRLSPLARSLASPVQGQARFVGRVDWTPAGVTSGGALSVPSLDFQSPAGKVSGLKGTVVFSNLAPLTATPGQVLSAESIGAIVPIAGVKASFGLDERALTITGGEAAMGGGRLRVQILHIPLAPDAVTTGVLVVEGVQLHELVEASPFGDRVDLDAKVSGRAPFSSQGGKVRVAGAELHAIQPGRLSINRQALSGVAASGSVSAPAGAAAPVAANDTFTDFAYQAMENLAFDKLDATIASRDDGRLGVLAHIVGRHDPPQHQEIKLSLFDLIRRKFLNKPLPLPSDTGVDLTLDTTLNLDDLLKDYGDFQQLHSSRPVQPARPTMETKSMETPR